MEKASRPKKKVPFRGHEKPAAIRQRIYCPIRNRQTVPESLACLFATVRMPTPDAMLPSPSQLAPMNLSGFLSVYGGLVPLGFAHSDSAMSIWIQYTTFPLFMQSRIRKMCCISQLAVLQYTCCSGKQVRFLCEPVAVRRFPPLLFLPQCRSRGNGHWSHLRRPNRGRAKPEYPAAGSFRFSRGADIRKEK